MTPTEIVEAALSVNLGSVPLSLAAVYAILGDKFVRPAVDRADTVTSKLRGRVSVLLAQAAQSFVEPAPVARVALVDVGGTPLERADISRPASIDSETFREAIRNVLDGSSAAFDSYWRATVINQRMKVLLRVIRQLLCVWPAVAVIGVAYFGLIKNGIWMTPTPFWAWTLALVTLIPFLLFVCAMPLMSYYASCIDRLDH